MQNATLKAVINTNVLNVRTEPNTEAKIWTQIAKDEALSGCGPVRRLGGD